MGSYYSRGPAATVLAMVSSPGYRRSRKLLPTIMIESWNITGVSPWAALKESTTYIPLTTLPIGGNPPLQHVS